MKCIYALPPKVAEAARRLAEDYTEACSALRADTIAKRDALQEFAESENTALLTLDDDDWAAAIENLSRQGGRGVVGELFWSPADALMLIGPSVDRHELDISAMALVGWLATQAEKQCSFVLLYV